MYILQTLLLIHLSCPVFTYRIIPLLSFLSTTATATAISTTSSSAVYNSATFHEPNPSVNLSFAPFSNRGNFYLHKYFSTYLHLCTYVYTLLLNLFAWTNLCVDTFLSSIKWNIAFKAIIAIVCHFTM